ncbi:MAG: hypothetical protein IPM34_03185 [Saprospiraceae bacterium]|nr:hypothetical protein [Saprospiraceae bacterium]
MVGLITVNISNSQIQSLRCLVVPTNQEISINEFYIIEPSSIIIFENNRRLNSDFIYDSVSKKIFLNHRLSSDSLRICYRVFPFKENHRIFLYDTQSILFPLTPEYALQSPNNPVKKTAWKTPGIQYSGNFTRGISSGNSQSLVLNSNLNLQLSGDLGDGITISGAISDQQIPFQADGNTRQIQEFDRIFIKLTRKNQSLTAGDFEVEKPFGYFMNYFKKNKGGLLETEVPLKKWKLQNKTALAISKGKSNRQTLITQNGNQGPYRLLGNSGETFIIILSGSEKVWLDGQLLQRGETDDYIIDYNLAEIKFMSGRLITDQSRIQVDFEYLDQNYTRSLVLHQSQIQKGNTKFYFNIFNEQDSKQSAISSDLDSLDKSILQSAGDQPELAVRSGIQKAGLQYNINRVYYRQRDTIATIQGNPQIFSYLYYDAQADSSALQVNFSEVGPGKGHYTLKQTTANGRVYEWLSPDPVSGLPRGNYEPVIGLIAPVSQWMITGGMQIKSINDASLSLELAYSSKDKNRLSSLEDDDNKAAAARIEMNTPGLQLFDSLLILKSKFHYEFVHQNFSFIQPFRSVEFNRDWNLSTLKAGTEHLPELSVEMSIGTNSHFEYTHSRLYRTDFYKGTRHTAQGRWKDKLTNVRLFLNQMNSTENTRTFSFFRPALEFNRKFNDRFALEFKAFRDQNQIQSSPSDSLSAGSFSFDVYECRIRNNFHPFMSSGLVLKYREDKRIDGPDFAAHSRSLEIGLETQIQKSPSGSWDFKFSGRKLNFQNRILDDSLAQFYFLGLFDHRLSLFKNAVQIRNYYELQSGVEPVQEFVFEERKPGEGNYIYIDFNKDQIRQIQEYVYAPNIDTARFVRFQLFNSEYQQSYQNSFNQVVQFDFRSFKKSGEIWKNALRSISFESSLRFSSKVNEESPTGDRINPFVFLVHPDQTISYQSFFRQSLYYNRGHHKFEMQLAFAENRQKILTTSGTDEKSVKDPQLKARYSLNNNIDLLLEMRSKKERRNSEFYADQNFQTRTFVLSPGAVIRIHKNLRTQVVVSYKKIDEQQFSQASSNTYDTDFQLSAYLQKRWTLRLQFYYLMAEYNGIKGSLAEYSLLEGFGDGHNFRWSLQSDYKISPVIQLQISYQARKAARSESIHTVRMQVQANF